MVLSIVRGPDGCLFQSRGPCLGRTSRASWTDMQHLAAADTQHISDNLGVPMSVCCVYSQHEGPAWKGCQHIGW